MELATIEMPRVEARKAYLEYREALQTDHDRELDEVRARQRAQDEAIAQGYRQLSIGNQLIQLTPTIAAGGFNDQDLPKLAVMQADIETVEVRRWRSGQMRYRPYQRPSWGDWNADISRSPRKVIEVDTPEFRSTRDSFTAVADLPVIPPQFRPSGHYRNYHLLWEAEWRQPRARRRAPRDPALLRHLGGDLWAVLATWDLTDVERAALEGGRVE